MYQSQDIKLRKSFTKFGNIYTLGTWFVIYFYWALCSKSEIGKTDGLTIYTGYTEFVQVNEFMTVGKDE